MATRKKSGSVPADIEATVIPLTRRGRPPRKVYINVLVKATTRDALSKIKAAGEFSSQGEVIDALVAQALAQRTRTSGG